MYDLTSLDRCSKDIRILPIVVAELEFSNIERHVLGAHLVERADNPAFKDRPEAFNRVGMNGADDILPLHMVDGGVREIVAKMFGNALRLHWPSLGRGRGESFQFVANILLGSLVRD
jgi:hypothetical protein